MLCYDRIEYSEGIDVNRKSASKEYDICDYQYFLNYSIKVVDLDWFLQTVFIIWVVLIRLCKIEYQN